MMADENDEMEELKRISKVMDRGYAGVFYAANNDKPIMELIVCKEWCRSISENCGVSVEDPVSNPDDPPDCITKISGKTIGIELVQLIEQQHIQRALKGESPYSGNLFHEMQWTQARFLKKLGDVIFKKASNYEKNNVKVDVLIIHTDETWLTSQQAKAWLQDVQVQHYTNITNAYLLFAYEPVRSRWPVIKLYGDLTEN